jgi:hypothetical protein
MAGVPGNLVNVTDGGSILKQMSPVERVSPLSSNRGRTPRTWSRVQYPHGRRHYVLIRSFVRQYSGLSFLGAKTFVNFETLGFRSSTRGAAIASDHSAAAIRKSGQPGIH